MSPSSTIRALLCLCALMGCSDQDNSPDAPDMTGATATELTADASLGEFADEDRTEDGGAMPAGDPAPGLLTGAEHDTSGGDAAIAVAEPVLCGENQRVLDHACVSCPLGTHNDAGNDVSGEDTTCTPVLCAENEHVMHHACMPCPPGKTNEAGDSVAIRHTMCDKVLCAEDHHVVEHTCEPCPEDSTNAEADDASGDDTACDLPTEDA